MLPHAIDTAQPARSARRAPRSRLLVPLCSGVLLALMTGCASQRIASSLERYGVPPDKAECVGDNLSDRLSNAQLQALGRAANSYKAVDRTSIPWTLLDLARVAAELRDPVIPIEIVRAGVKCLVLPIGSTT